MMCIFSLIVIIAFISVSYPLLLVDFPCLFARGGIICIYIYADGLKRYVLDMITNWDDR